MKERFIFNNKFLRRGDYRLRKERFAVGGGLECLRIVIIDTVTGRHYVPWKTAHIAGRNTKELYYITRAWNNYLWLVARMPRKQLITGLQERQKMFGQWYALQCDAVRWRTQVLETK